MGGLGYDLKEYWESDLNTSNIQDVHGSGTNGLILLINSFYS